MSELVPPATSRWGLCVLGNHAGPPSMRGTGLNPNKLAIMPLCLGIGAGLLSRQAPWVNPHPYGGATGLICVTSAYYSSVSSLADCWGSLG